MRRWPGGSGRRGKRGLLATATGGPSAISSPRAPPGRTRCRRGPWPPSWRVAQRPVAFPEAHLTP
eukprot:9478673-Alexandrium_andersonii.AAC.1